MELRMKFWPGVRREEIGEGEGRSEEGIREPSSSFRVGRPDLTNGLERVAVLASFIGCWLVDPWTRKLGVVWGHLSVAS